MKDILKDIQDGEFAKGWILENQANRPVFNAINNRENQHQIEVVGREVKKNDAICKTSTKRERSGSRCEKLIYLKLHFEMGSNPLV